jgi:dTDP-4-amino-4,6-dideoxygalactose transaminase
MKTKNNSSHQTKVKPTNRKLPVWPSFTGEEIEAVKNVLKTGKVNYWTGEEGRLFEKEYAEYVGTKYAVTLMNGTVALDAALYALGIGEGDDFIVTPRTFIASASAAVLRGARPIFADVDLNSQNITAASIEKVLTPKTRAIIAVHLAGWPCEIDLILKLAKKHRLYVIEDCAQAHGATYNGRQVGSFGDIACFSFCQDKIITTGGEGGLVTTNSLKLWSKIWSYKDHGKNYNAVYSKHHKPGFRWFHHSFGTNYRMTEIQAVIGRIQLRKLSEWIMKRNRNADILTECLSKFNAVRLTIPPDYIKHAYYKYYTFIRPEMLKKGWSRDKIIEAISAEGIPCFSGSCSEIYLEKAFANNELVPFDYLPNARELGETSLMLLVHPTITEDNMIKITKIIEHVMVKASA